MTDRDDDSDLDDLRAGDAAVARWAPRLLAAVAALVALDLVADGLALGEPIHVVVELGAIALAASGAWALRRRAEGAHRRQVAALAAQVAEARGVAGAAAAEAARWRAEAESALRGLGDAIDHQCDRWGLSAAEREVALLLLKGLSLKEVAAARDTSERTARQQALAVYRKSGLGGRAELAAFFLEDLLLPARGAPP